MSAYTTGLIADNAHSMFKAACYCLILLYLYVVLLYNYDSRGRGQDQEQSGYGIQRFLGDLGRKGNMSTS
jgi:hypothetical protein